MLGRTASCKAGFQSHSVVAGDADTQALSMPVSYTHLFDSIRKYTLEETYEVFDAIERRDWPHLTEELGDLLLQVLFYAEMAANEGHFTIADVLDQLNRKLVRRRCV